MSFVTQEDVLSLTEELYTQLAQTLRPDLHLTSPFPRLTYAECMRRFGTDKPDLRNPIEMQVVSDHFRGSGFGIFAKLLEQEGTQVRAIPAPKGGSRKFADRMNAFAQQQGLPGMGSLIRRGERKDDDDRRLRAEAAAAPIAE